MCGLHFAVLDGKTTLLPVFAIPAVSRSTAFGRPREVRRTAANIPHMGCLLRSSKLPSCAFKRQNFVLCGGRRGFAGFLPRAKTSTLPPFRRMAKPYSVNGGRKLFVQYFPQNDFIDSLKALPLGRAFLIVSQYYRASRAVYSRRGMTLLYAGRMIFPALISSSTRWALQPAIREMAKMGVYSSSGRFSIL